MGAGRPKIEIDPNLVLELVKGGAKVTEIADYCGVSTDTIHRNYAAELIKGKADLKINLRQWQLSAAKAGNATMLIWLGKQMLAQSDYVESEASSKDTTQGKKSFEDFCTTAG